SPERRSSSRAATRICTPRSTPWRTSSIARSSSTKTVCMRIRTMRSSTTPRRIDNSAPSDSVEFHASPGRWVRFLRARGTDWTILRVSMNLVAKLLPPSNILLDLDVTSKKRMFEQAGLLFENNQGVARSLVFDSLFARERLGSTGLGQGLAIPHGRIKGLKEAVGAF